MNWLLAFFVVFIILTTCGVFDVDSYRVALASDIESGTLVLSEKASAMINKGDLYLEDSGDDRGEGWQKKYWRRFRVFDEDLFRAFIAKVWYERARLEMEISK